MRTPVWLGTLGCVVLITGCSGTMSMGDGGTGGGGGGTGGVGEVIDTEDGGLCTDTWESYGQPFFATTCAGCHEHDHANFVTHSVVLSELGLIQDKVSQRLMPKDEPLPEADRHRLLTFLACGAKSAAPPDAGVPFEAEAARIAVAKVKNVLVGLPPTDAEVAAVAADEKAMAGLVTEWQKRPEYDEKMKVFFELAFQQTQITPADFIDLIPPTGMGTGAAVPLVVQNARESFARTVIALNAEGKPLTEAFTTRRVMLTTALMELYGFLDTRRVDDNGKFNDTITKYKNATLTIGNAAGPVPIEQSVDPNSPNFMHWYDPDVSHFAYSDMTCNTDPITMPVASLSVHYLLYGEVQQHQGPAGYCPPKAGTLNGVQLTSTDFSDWRMVTLRPPIGSEPISVFFDLPKLRKGTELVLNTPRPGFFSTPAFFANWPTNISNQMRVTLNQALIVATGMAVDGLDPTPSPQTPGLDAAHAGSTECYACHRLLDPSRSILSSTWSWFYYPQTDQALIAQKGRFIFRGVDTTVSNIDDFAKVLAQHPAVAGAWAQKLCTYANSAPCVPSDPEFQRVVAAFSSSNFSWATLVRELMSSPLVTNLSPSTTNGTNGEVIAVTRRDHLCAALNGRLGLSDVCGLTLVLGKKVGVGAVPQIVSGMPSDGYGRGATEPVLPNQPTLFYRAALENICVQVAGLVIDSAVSASQPNAKHWVSTDPDTAISDFVSIVVGIVPADSRFTPVKTLLQTHFSEARKTQGKSDSLKSTFVTACLSPTFIGVGM